MGLPSHDFHPCCLANCQWARDLNFQRNLNSETPCTLYNYSPNQDVVLPTIVRTIVGTIVSRVTGGDGKFVDLMIILY